MMNVLASVWKSYALISNVCPSTIAVSVTHDCHISSF